MKEIDERINEIILHGEEKQAIALSSPWAHQFMQLGKRSQKKNYGTDHEAKQHVAEP